MTKKEMFVLIASVNQSNKDIVDFCNHEIELLDKKASTPSKPSANQLENEKLRPEILEVLASADAPLTISAITELLNANRTAPLKSQRVSALVTQLKNGGQVVRTEVKRVAYFTLATPTA